MILFEAVFTGSGHVAVWMGVSSSDAQNWLQAGVEKTKGSGVAEYIEVGKRGRQVSLRLWPTRFGHKAKVVLRRRRSLWKISIDSHTSRWAYVPGARLNTLSLLEIYRSGGEVHGVGRIDQRTVHG